MTGTSRQMHGGVAAVLLLLLTVACASPQPKAPPVARHLVLVTIDTLRADRLGCYGNARVATPNMDRIAREGALAEDATVHVPLTRPSHISLFTGLYPAQHGIRDNVSPTLAKTIPTLTELLRAAGFRTAAFVSSIVVSAQSGLDRGFETYSDRFEIGADDARFLNTIQKRGDESVGEAVEWLRAHARERMAAWIHLYDPHDPYEPPEPYATQYADRPYDGEVAWSDELIGRLEAALDSLGLKGETLVVVTSDHGEGLGEHDEVVHGYFVYETTLRVPLIFRGPGIAPGARVRATARTIDVMPTLLDLVGVAKPEGLRLPGRSLAPALRGQGQVDDASTYAESLTPLLHYGWSDLRTLRDGRWKYILAPRPELYDLQQDPDELADLAASQPARARALRAALEARLRDEQQAQRAQPTADVPPDLLEKLGALGYVSPGGGPEGSAAAGADPKDTIGEYKVINRLMREGLTKLRTGDYAGSAEHLGALRARGIESFEVNYYLGRALVGLRRYRDAIPRFERAIEKLPSFGSAYLAMADCRIALRDFKGALAALERGRGASPKHPELYEREAEIWRKLGDRRRAIRTYEAMLPLVPKDALVRVRLGELSRDVGEIDHAIRYLKEAVSLDPAPASYWNSLGMVLGGRGDLTGAEDAFREALQRDGSNPQYLYNLGLVLRRLGRPQDAAVQFRKVLEVAPGFRPARDRLAELK